jgi:hypothetical protein
MRDYGVPYGVETGPRAIGAFRILGGRWSLGCIAQFCFNGSAPEWFSGPVPSRETWRRVGAFLRLHVSASMARRLNGAVLSAPETRAIARSRSREMARLIRVYLARVERDRAKVRVATDATIDRLASSVRPLRASNGQTWKRTSFSVPSVSRLYRATTRGRTLSGRWSFATQDDASRVASGTTGPLYVPSTVPSEIASRVASPQGTLSRLALGARRTDHAIACMERARAIRSARGLTGTTGRAFHSILADKIARARAWSALSCAIESSITVWTDRDEMADLCDRNPREALRRIAVYRPIADLTV